ncbi:hypothetical protein BJV78DRAFT_1158009 [Lactifluus subvellereus]|nr:hypothetical protein BJV78DRAFT_1158009 [Lactifluus subvellereus]
MYHSNSNFALNKLNLRIEPRGLPVAPRRTYPHLYCSASAFVPGYGHTTPKKYFLNAPKESILLHSGDVGWGEPSTPLAGANNPGFGDRGTLEHAQILTVERNQEGLYGKGRCLAPRHGKGVVAHLKTSMRGIEELQDLWARDEIAIQDAFFQPCSDSSHTTSLTLRDPTAHAVATSTSVPSSARVVPAYRRAHMVLPVTVGHVIGRLSFEMGWEGEMDDAVREARSCSWKHDWASQRVRQHHCREAPVKLIVTPARASGAHAPLDAEARREAHAVVNRGVDRRIVQHRIARLWHECEDARADGKTRVEGMSTRAASSSARRERLYMSRRESPESGTVGAAWGAAKMRARGGAARSRGTGTVVVRGNYGAGVEEVEAAETEAVAVFEAVSAVTMLSALGLKGMTRDEGCPSQRRMCPIFARRSEGRYIGKDLRPRRFVT